MSIDLSAQVNRWLVFQTKPCLWTITKNRKSTTINGRHLLLAPSTNRNYADQTRKKEKKRKKKTVILLALRRVKIKLSSRNDAYQTRRKKTKTKTLILLALRRVKMKLLSPIQAETMQTRPEEEEKRKRKKKYTNTLSLMPS